MIVFNTELVFIFIFFSLQHVFLSKGSTRKSRNAVSPKEPKVRRLPSALNPAPPMEKTTLNTLPSRSVAAPLWWTAAVLSIPLWADGSGLQSALPLKLPLTSQKTIPLILSNNNLHLRSLPPAPLQKKQQKMHRNLQNPPHRLQRRSRIRMRRWRERPSQCWTPLRSLKVRKRSNRRLRSAGGMSLCSRLAPPAPSQWWRAHQSPAKVHPAPLPQWVDN